LSSHTKGLERYTATLRIRPSRRQSYHGYFYYDSNGGPGTHTRRHLSAGITASIVLRHSTTFDVGVRSNVFEDIEDQDRDVIELSLRQKLFRQTELVFRGHYTDYRAEGKSRHLAFMVEYNIPFGMPVSRRDEVGTLRGEVYDQETGLPIKDVILKLADATAVTDKAGRFSFPTSPVGTHHLTVDRASIGLGRITRRRFPMEISVEGGKTASIEIAVVRGATVTGRIDVYAYEDSTSGILTPDSRRRLEKTGGLANTLIELTDGEETKRLLTAGDGSFSVHELRPGRWTFVIPPEHLPEHCSVENPDMHFTLQPGEAHTVSIRIIPRERPIRILEDGGTLIEEARQ
jgi:hypothetical protein